MALDRLLPVSTTPGTVTGNAYMDAVQEEVTGLWDRSVISLTGVSGTNTITATVTPTLTAGLVSGMMFILIPAATNTGAVTLNGANVLDAEGTALTAGALRINNHYFLWTNGTNYYVVGYTPAAAVPYGTKLLAAFSASSSSSIDFFNGASNGLGGTIVLDGTYDNSTLQRSSAAPATDDVEAWLRIGTGATPTYQTANYNWYFRGAANNSARDIGANSAGQMVMSASSATLDVGNATNEFFSATIHLTDPDSSSAFKMYGQATYRAAVSATAGGSFMGEYAASGPVTAIRFMFETGNIATGTFQLYGHAKT